MPLLIASASVSPAGPIGFTAAGRSVAILFGRASALRIEANGSIVSDAARLPVRAGEDLLVTVTTKAPTTDIVNNAGFLSQYSPAGGGDPVVSKSRPPFSLIEVLNSQAPCTIVTLGDSITEGAISSEQGWRGWPGRLAQRLIEASPLHHCGVVNMGISGNRLLTAGRGPSAIDRLTRDVLSVPGATHLIVMIGVNDIRRSGEGSVTAADLIAGYQRVIAIARSRGLKVIGGTMTPGLGLKYTGAALVALHSQANDWIRKSDAFDGVIDFEAALRAPGAKAKLRPEFDSGDGLHPNDAGQTAMASAIPLTLFR